MTLIHSLDIISSFIIGLPLIAGALLLSKISTSAKYFFSFIITNCVFQITLQALAFYDIENIWLINLSALFDLILCLFFINSIFLVCPNRNIMQFSTLLTIVFIAINTYFGWDQIVKSTFLGSEFIALILVLFSLVYITKYNVTTSHYIFLILVPLSLYLASIILVFLAFDIALDNNNQSLFVFYYYALPIINIAAYGCYAIAFYLDARPKLNPRN